TFVQPLKPAPAAPFTEQADAMNMKMPHRTWILAVSLAATLSLCAHAAVDFAKEVVPILKSRCIECHGPEKQKGKLRLDSKADLLKGGQKGEGVKARVRG